MAKTNEKSTRSQTNKWKNEKSKVRRSKRTIGVEIRSQSSSGFQSKLLLSEKRTSPRHKTPITKTTKTKTPQKTPKTAAAAAKTPSSSSSPTATTPTTKGGSANNSSNSSSSSSKSSSKKNKDKKVKTPPKSKTPPVTAKTSKANSSVTPTNTTSTTSNKNSSPAATATPAATTTNNSAGADKSFSVENKPVKKAYVVFVGNLPYSVTKEQLEEHFRKTGGVKKVRIPTVRGTNKPRGFAYIEFKDRISHKIGLRMHHTHLNGRQINVEFTSIGGNNPRRREKLQQKNSKLSKMKRDYTRPESSWK